MATRPALRTLALCAGYGGLEIGLGAACEHVGWRHCVAAYVEREAYAAALLACRMDAGAMDQAPVWSDLTTFDAASWRGSVDCVTAGFPCQPHSHAGTRKGTADERWIWPDIARIIRESGAWLVVLENVAGLLSSGGFAPVLTDLAALGFAAEWGVLSAGSVGASHRRERVFIVAYRHEGLREWQCPDSSESAAGTDGRGHDRGDCAAVANTGCTEGRRPDSGREPIGRSVAGGSIAAVADPKRVDRQRRGITGIVECEETAESREARERQRDGNAADDCQHGMADTSEPRRQGREQRIACDGNRGGRKHMDQLANFATHCSRPAPTMPDGPPSSQTAPTSRPRLNPAFVCWLMGLPPAWTNIAHTNFDAAAMASYHSKLRSELSRCLGGSGLGSKAA